ncbi:hypothetical protein SBBP2_890034 [Burkholderiales bacterium]|jgi:hypothetical protein|nr:hypothetical protein SBBP2_890034 [Burkholderiales bacterium]
MSKKTLADHIEEREYATRMLAALAPEMRRKLLEMAVAARAERSLEPIYLKSLQAGALGKPLSEDEAYEHLWWGLTCTRLDAALDRLVDRGSNDDDPETETTVH